MTYEKAAEAAAFIKSRYSGDIRAAIVLGSGLGAFGEQLADAVRIPFSGIPGFVRSTVEGHAGQLVIGNINGVTVAVQQGRFHYYEGYDMEQVTLPVRTFGVLGVKNLIFTNAAGSLSSDMPPGSPFGPGIVSLVTYLHACQMVSYSRLTEVLDGEHRFVADFDKPDNVGLYSIENFDARRNRLLGFRWFVDAPVRVHRGGMPTMTVGLVTDPAQANDIVASGKADMVALGRGAMWDPRFAWHAAEALGAEAQYAPKMMACHPKLRPQVFPGRAS